MSIAMLGLLAVVIGLIVSAVLTPLVAAAATRFGVVDLPNARNVTRAPTPRVGGLAIAAGFFLVLPLLFAVDLSASKLDLSEITTFFACALVILILGVFDDVIGVSSKLKFLALVVVAAAMCGVGVRIDAIVLNTQPVLNLGLFAWPITILWIVAVTVAINFIDGLDGLAAGIAAIASGTVAAVALANDAAAVAVPALGLTASLVGFLIFNFHPARIFMGDCGSLFLGFTLATLSVMLHNVAGTTQGLLLPAIALSVPLLDTAVTLVRRGVIDRRSLFTAERGHIHHRLIDHQGLRHQHAVVVLWIVSLAAALLGALALVNKGWATIAGLAVLVPMLAGLFHIAGSVRLREMLSAVRRNRKVSDTNRNNQAIFDEMQNRFRTARDLHSWWNMLCDAGERLGFSSIQLPLGRRDGEPLALAWVNPSMSIEIDPDSYLHAEVPVPQRRKDGGVRAKVKVSAHDSLESAGQRLALFSRLLAEHGLNVLDVRTRSSAMRLSGGMSGMGGPIDRQPVGEAERGTHGRPPSRENPRVAIVHDFLYTYAGAERVLEQLVNVYPDAEIFTLFDFLDESQRGFIQGKKAHTSFIQKLPFARKRHRVYLPLMPLAIEQHDLSGFDIILSSSYLAAKGVITRPSQLHVCYCHSPARYAWDLQHQYLRTSNMERGLRSLLAKMVLHYLRLWDTRSANSVDLFLTNSDFVGRRVEKIYRRSSTTIYPPADVDFFSPGEAREDFYFSASRLVPYKRMELLVESFRRMPEKRLIIAGDGPELESLRAGAPANVKVLGHISGDDLRRYMQLARAFLFAAEEDFGIVLVEAAACGTPAIAFGRGGAREIIVENQTGLFFHRQQPEDVVAAIRDFESREWNHQAIQAHAAKFGAERFRTEIRDFVAEHWEQFADRLGLEASAAPAEDQTESVAS